MRIKKGSGSAVLITAIRQSEAHKKYKNDEQKIKAEHQSGLSKLMMAMNLARAGLYLRQVPFSNPERDAINGAIISFGDRVFKSQEKGAKTWI